MKLAMAVVALVALSVAPLMAGQNENCKAFMDVAGATDNAGVVTRIDPDAFSLFSVYLGLTDCGSGAGEGVKSVSFALTYPPGMASTAIYENLLPGGLAIGDWETGVTLAGSGCLEGPFLIFGVARYIYTGVPGTIVWTDHPQFPRRVEDCSEPTTQTDFFCVWTNCGVGQDAPAGEAGCTPNTPVEQSSWGAIKALYR